MTSPNLTYGQVPTAGQWNSYFSGKQDSLGYTPLNQAGGVMTGLLRLSASTALGSGFNLTTGTAPTTPSIGDVWMTAGGLYYQIGSTTVGPLGPGSVTSIGLTAPIQFTVSGSPVTGSGSLGLSWVNQSANQFFAGATSGGAAVPAFRALVAADLPAGAAVSNLGYTPLNPANNLSDVANPATAASNIGAVGVSSVNRFTAVQEFSKGANLASASTLTVGTDGNFFHVTGTTTITALGTLPSGTQIKLVFDGALILTHNGTSLILPTGANITTTPGDCVEFVSEGSGNWRCVDYQRADGRQIQESAVVLGTPVTASGTAVTFTGIPSWAKRITVNLAAISTNGSSLSVIRLGTAGGVETTGYSAGIGLVSAVPSAVASTNGFSLPSGAASASRSGSVIFTLLEPATNTWSAAGSVFDTGNTVSGAISGSKALAGTIDRVSLTTVNGTDTFDAGTVNITYE